MRTISGKVISAKMNKTVVVEVTSFLIHPIYQKRIKKTRNLHAHNEVGAKVGQVVVLQETRPISKTKHWKVSEVNPI